MLGLWSHFKLRPNEHGVNKYRLIGKIQLLSEELNTVSVHKGVVAKYKAVDRKTVQIQLKELPNTSFQLVADNWCVDRGDKVTLVCVDMSNIDDTGMRYAFGYANQTQGISDFKPRPIGFLLRVLCFVSAKGRKLIHVVQKYNNFVTDASHKHLLHD